MDSVQSKIEAKIRSFRRGKILTATDFKDLGSEDAVRMALMRLTRSRMIHRLSQGIYLYPKRDPEIGLLLPSVEEVAKAIAQRDKARVIPSGLLAMQLLGFTTQVPMKATYLTDGAPRKITVGKRLIEFKPTTPKKLAMKSPISTLITQALIATGKHSVTPEIRKAIRQSLQKEKAEIIEKDMFLAPAWIRALVKEELKKITPPTD